MRLTDQGQDAWIKFLANSDNHGHASRNLTGKDIQAHVEACWKSALATVSRVKTDLPELQPKRVLEIGSSAGLNCYALQSTYRDAEVYGIEPEKEAVNAARSMRSEAETEQPEFMIGVGECIPFQDTFFDLIVCHTVIEHVQNVELVVKEMARVLRPGGAIHLEAPNYNFPYEPHLGIYTVPLLGKKFVEWTAIVQGKTKNIRFIDHIQFVTANKLENLFLKNNLSWENRAETKVRNACNGTADIKKYKILGLVLFVMNKLRIGRIVASLVNRFQIYPSVLYTISKN